MTQTEPPRQCGRRRMGEPDKEVSFLSYRSYEREQSRREEASRVRERGEQKPNGIGGWRREGKQANDRPMWRLIEEGEACSTQ